MTAKLRLVQPSDPDEPIDVYINQVNKGTTDTLPYERLMIWYRKEKQYKEEIEVIDKGIMVLKKLYANQQKQTLSGKLNPSIRALSEKISKTTGLHDKKGNEVYLPDPLPKWIKRKMTAEEKLKKLKTKTAKKRKK